MRYVKTVELSIDITPELLNYLNRNYLVYDECAVSEDPSKLTEEELETVYSVLEELDMDLLANTEFVTHETTVKIEEILLQNNIYLL